MSVTEAARLAALLRADPSSMLAAAVEGWSHPISRETLAVLDLFDLTVAANSDPKRGRPKPHSGRPFNVDDRTRTRRGNVGSRTPDEVKAILAEFGHAPPV